MFVVVMCCDVFLASMHFTLLSYRFLHVCGNSAILGKQLLLLFWVRGKQCSAVRDPQPLNPPPPQALSLTAFVPLSLRTPSLCALHPLSPFPAFEPLKPSSLQAFEPPPSWGVNSFCIADITVMSTRLSQQSTRLCVRSHGRSLGSGRLLHQPSPAVQYLVTSASTLP